MITPAYIRSIDYGNNDPRCDPDSAEWNAEFDIACANVADADGCYRATYDGNGFKRGDFVTQAQARQFAMIGERTAAEDFATSLLGFVLGGWRNGL